MKNHIIEFFGDPQPVVGAIIGTNGYVWIYAPTPNQQQKKEDVKIPIIQKVDKAQRELMAVLRNAMLCL
jgi:exosome complex RNA-binding protein Rrp4